MDDAGVYTVLVNDANCSVESPPAALTVSTAPPPPGRIEIEWASPNVILSWTGTYVLQSSLSVTGVYSDILGATSPYTNIVAGNSSRYFLLRTP